MKFIKSSIVGARGYTGQECLRILTQHPNVRIESLVSSSRSGEKIAAASPALAHKLPEHFSSSVSGDEDFIFLCLPHGASKSWLRDQRLSAHTKLIDLSHDHRYQGSEFCYGLPEINHSLLSGAHFVANPGCFATAIQLALLPFWAEDLSNKDIHIHAITGSTGAGQELTRSSHFTGRQNNISVYKVFRHQHLAEIEQTLDQKNGALDMRMFMTPIRGPFTRGIFCTVEFILDRSEEDIRELFQCYFKDHPFVSLCDQEPSLKDVLFTNHCFISVKKFKNYVQVISVLDNLMKGAAGQAVQNMNLMAGLPQETGLQYSPIIH